MLYKKVIKKGDGPDQGPSRPEWFTPVFIGNVDDDLLPPEVLVQQNQNDGGSWRRSSIGERMGSVRRRSTARVAPIENSTRD